MANKLKSRKRKQKFTAKLVGGPFDGKTVEIVGVRFEKLFCWKKAIYEWDMDGDEIIGRFKRFEKW